MIAVKRCRIVLVGAAAMLATVPACGAADAASDLAVAGADDGGEETVSEPPDGAVGAEDANSRDGEYGGDTGDATGDAPGSAAYDARLDVGTAEPDALLDAAPWPSVCGDGYRDSATEECDDGLGDLAVGNARACSSACKVVDRVVAGPSGGLVRTGGLGGDDVLERWLGAGRHPAAGNGEGSSVVWTELVSPDAGGAVRLGVATFDADGVRQGMLAIEDVPFVADPVMAALPDGTFAVAFNSLAVDGDGLGIALAHVDGDGALIGSVQAANATAWFGQHSPDIIWTGSKLAVSWEDESAIPRRFCTRSFSSAVAALSGEVCEEYPGSWASRLALASFGGDVVRSWREEMMGDAGAYAVAVVSDGANTWTSSALGLPAAEEAAAVAAIDATHLLVVVGDEDGLLTATVLDDGLSLVGQVNLCTSGEARFTPALAVTDDGIYLAWRAAPLLIGSDAGWDSAYEDVWVQKIGWDGYDLDASAVPIMLPAESSTWDGDQRRPALAGVPYESGGALLAAWEDLVPDNYVDERPHGDVIATLIPTPILRGGE